MSGKADGLSRVQPESIRSFCLAVCQRTGLSPSHAGRLADTLLEADMRGVHTHGVVRLPHYVKGFQTGKVNMKPAVKVVRDSGAAAVIDGDNGLGAIIAQDAMKLAMEKAAGHGVGIVSMRASSHYGMAAHWTMMALERDMIGYTTTDGPASMAPWGGVTPVAGNNPISYAIPAGKELPVVLDMSLSVVAKGKIMLAAMKNEPIPAGWALDKSGQPTTDAKAAMEGLLMPIAGYKGLGLALVNDILCGVLSGGLFGTDIPKLQPGVTLTGVSHFFMALDIAHFMPVAELKERVDRLVQMVKSSQMAEGQDRIYLPGEMEFEKYQRSRREGIRYSQEIIGALDKLAQDTGIPAVKR
ncbi:MAG: Ldh family oxidoreductase [Chloroflexota bacterium]